MFNGCVFYFNDAIDALQTGRYAERLKKIIISGANPTPKINAAQVKTFVEALGFGKYSPGLIIDIVDHDFGDAGAYHFAEIIKRGKIKSGVSLGITLCGITDVGVGYFVDAFREAGSPEGLKLFLFDNDRITKEGRKNMKRAINDGVFSYGNIISVDFTHRLEKPCLNNDVRIINQRRNAYTAFVHGNDYIRNTSSDKGLPRDIINKILEYISAPKVTNKQVLNVVDGVYIERDALRGNLRLKNEYSLWKCYNSILYSEKWMNDAGKKMEIFCYNYKDILGLNKPTTKKNILLSVEEKLYTQAKAQITFIDKAKGLLKKLYLFISKLIKSIKDWFAEFEFKKHYVNIPSPKPKASPDVYSYEASRTSYFISFDSDKIENRSTYNPSI